MLIRIRSSNMGDCYDLWKWRNHPDVRKRCFESFEIDYEDHKKWFDKKISDENTKIYIAENESGEKVGQIRFEIINPCKGVVSVNLNPDFFTKKLGHVVIKEGTVCFSSDFKDVKNIDAEIAEENIASQKAFEKAGYTFKEDVIVKGKKAKIFVYRR